MPSKKKTPQKHYDILTGMEIVDREPEEQLKIDPAAAGEDRSATTWAKRVSDTNPPPVSLTETYKHPERTPDEIMKEEYPEVMRSPDSTQILLCILRELVMMRKGVHA